MHSKSMEQLYKSYQESLCPLYSIVYQVGLSQPTHPAQPYPSVLVSKWYYSFHTMSDRNQDNVIFSVKSILFNPNNIF